MIKRVVTDTGQTTDKAMDLREEDLGAVKTIAVLLLDSQTDNPVGDASIWITTDGAGFNTIAGGRTSAAGEVTLAYDLSEGDIYLWAVKSGWSSDLTPAPFTVEDESATLYMTEVEDLTENTVTVDMIRNRVNIPEPEAMPVTMISAAISDAEMDVTRDAFVLPTDNDWVRAVTIYAVYYAIRTYSTRGRHVPTGHKGPTGHWVADTTPQGIFDFKPAMVEAKAAYDAMKTSLRPKPGLYAYTAG